VLSIRGSLPLIEEPRNIQEKAVANHPQAIKRHRQSLKRRSRNRDCRTQMKSSIKALHTAIDEGAPKETLQQLFQKAESTIARTGRKGVIKKQTVARKVSRLAKAVTTAPEKAVKAKAIDAKKKSAPRAPRAKKKK
jgi:small subunit ribosomal protein S20